MYFNVRVDVILEFLFIYSRAPRVPKVQNILHMVEKFAEGGCSIIGLPCYLLEMVVEPLTAPGKCRSLWQDFQKDSRFIVVVLFL